ncbi:MAG: hypothetical protein ACR2H6_05170 [Pyrinomonadaceae bacterium]
MSEEDKNFDQSEAGSVTDSAIRRSLLGRADAIDQAKFEALLMLDDGFESRVHRLELELADGFSFGELSSAEQKLFTSRFLVTTGRVRELEVSEALRKVLSRQSTGQTSAGQHWNLSSLNLFAFDRPFGSAMLAGLALLVCGTLFWLSLKAPSVRPPSISKRQTTAGPEKQFAHPVVSPDPRDNPANDRGVTQQQVPTITLQRESRSESKQTVQVSNAGVAAIRLELLVNVNVDPRATYEAKLLSADGLQVETFSDLKVQPGSQPKVVFDLAGHNLKSGDYSIQLRSVSAGGTQGSERYSFIVKQE